MAIKNPQIEAAVDAYVAARGPKAVAALADDVRDYIEACAVEGIDLTGGEWEGLFIKGGLVRFHSSNGQPTGIPTAARLIEVLDFEALERLKARFEQKINP